MKSTCFFIYLLTLLACNVLNAQTYVDEMTETTTGVDAIIDGSIHYEVYSGNDVGNDRFGDPTYAMRSSNEGDVSIWYSNDGGPTVLEGKKLTGIKINFLCADLNEASRKENLLQLFYLDYSTDGGGTWTRLTDYAFDYVYDANKGEGWWEDWCVQTALPADAGDVKLTLVGGITDNYIPLLRRTEIFYEGGSPYAYQKPEGAYTSIDKIPANGKTFNVSSKDGRVLVSNVLGKQVAVYSVEGKCVFSSPARTDFVEIPLNSGIYLVKAGNETQKIIIKGK